MVMIRYVIIILTYTIFYNVSCAMRETSTEPISTNIKYSILRYDIDATNIKYVKIRKVGQ